jgi:hypothetical protein
MLLRLARLRPVNIAHFENMSLHRPRKLSAECAILTIFLLAFVP